MASEPFPDPDLSIRVVLTAINTRAHERKQGNTIACFLFHYRGDLVIVCDAAGTVEGHAEE
ncbi:hypothetical protein SAY87_011174 [Trapa incisa]|uniref:Uncharacterized protein n=1 Tax=Trapa incisa TaxID=236973 RepID=A0AAN7JIK7_9MYRT|nr:hypothetical protein SAY87_011174 [Trapa incisa]